MIIAVDGQDYDITNWDEFSKKLLTSIGSEVEESIVNEIIKMDLISPGGSAEFFQSIRFDVSGDTLTIYSDVPYAAYLEYGTYEYWNIYGLHHFPKTPDPKKTRATKNVFSNMKRSSSKRKFNFKPLKRVLFSRNKGLQGVKEIFRILKRYTKSKKSSSSKQTSKKNLPKGMQPFAPFRRVIYNKKKMEQVISKAANRASG